MSEKECWFCGSQQWDRDAPYLRRKQAQSDKYNLVVPLCHYHHNEPPDGVHHNQENNLILKRWAQEQFEETHTRQEFREVFGKNYLEDDDE